MYILVTYDINTTTETGSKRLRNVAKICLNYGQRVQHSVFECKVDEGQYVELKHKLYNVIDKQTDSLRFYRLGKNYKSTIESMGKQTSYDVDGLLLF